MVEVVGNALRVEPAHMGETALNVGVGVVFTVIIKEAEFAHCPTDGVNE